MEGRSRTCRGAGFALAALLVASVWPVGAQACPFCGGPMPTLVEQLAKSDVTLFVELKASREGTDQQPPASIYKIVAILRDSTERLKQGHTVEVPGLRTDASGDFAFLFGTKLDTLEWASPIPATKEVLKYVTDAPSFDAAPKERLTYHLRFFEHADLTIANDAYSEFSNASYEDILRVVDNMPREKLRGWVLGGETPPTRLGLYGLMLGLCGEARDAELLERTILQPGPDGLGLGYDGVMAGYLLLKGVAGLDVVDKALLGNKRAPAGGTFAAVQAVRFLLQYAGDRVPKERVHASLRLLLDRPELAEVVIADFARAKDWTVQDRLRDLYGRDGYDSTSMKKAIVRYMFAASKDVAKGNPSPEQTSPPSHVKKALKALDAFRATDPKLVRDVERFLY